LQESGDAREFYQIVAVHEMAHQWWGHLVGWKTYHDQWLSEGIAEFSAALYLAKFQADKFRSFWDLKRDRLVQKNPAGHRPVDVGPLWLGPQLSSYLEPELYQRLVYFKGAYVMEMLRTMMENPRDKEPDGRFINMMRDFVSTYAGRNASTEDFRRVVEKHMGEPMDWFFNQWVYGTEIPSFDFKYRLREEGGKTILAGELTQSGVSSNFQSRVPFYVYVNGHPRRLGLIAVQGSSTARGDISLGFKPEKVTIDETHSIPCVDR
jgi:aminopeptidase N